MKQIFSVITWLFFVLFFAGCATYTAPDLPKEQMAKIKESEAGDGLVNIESIDGVAADSVMKMLGLENKESPLSKEFWLKTADDVFDIGPGKRVIGLKYERGEWYAHGRVSFVAQKGKSYEATALIAQPKKTSWWRANPEYVFFVIKDEATGKIVGESEQ